MTKTIRTSIFLLFFLGSAVHAEDLLSPSPRFSSSLGSLFKQTDAEAPASKAGGKNGTFGACSGTPIDGMEIHVLGEVGRPGTFWVLPGTRVDEAIACAGEVTPIGSIRRIVLKRGENRNEKFIDLFSYRYNGNLNENPYLSNQDVLFVPPYTNRIRIVGAVKRPDVYEILSTEGDVKSAIKLAGGFTLLTDPSIAVTLLHPRISESHKDPIEFEKTELTPSDIETGKGELQNGDIVVAHDAKNRNIPFELSTIEIPGENSTLPTGFNKVFVTGDVTIPGPLPFRNYYGRRDYAHESGVTKTSNMKRLKVIAHNGQVRGKRDPVAPGDIVYVPSKKATLANSLQIWNVTTSSFLTGFTIYSIFENN